MGRPKILIFTIFWGIFSSMALSNAIIPILPGFNISLELQAYIFSAYYFGAMVTTLPGGIISDRIGQIPVIGTALSLTVISGLLLMISTNTMIILFIRLVEGVGAGLFVAAALSWINYQPDHTRLSGLFMALLNFGLLIGLIGGGWITGFPGYLSGGVVLFTILSIIPLVSFLLSYSRVMKDNPVSITGEKNSHTGWRELLYEVSGMGMRQLPLWYSVIVLLGIGGFIQAVYPELSGLPASDISIALAGMNLATIIASLMAPRIQFEPVLFIRVSSLLLGILVLIFIQFPLSIFIMGFAVGLITISQMNYLAMAERHQGIAMGLFSTSSYAGMTLIPALGGYVSRVGSVSVAAIIIAILAIICAIFIGRCKCRGFINPSP